MKKIAVLTLALIFSLSFAAVAFAYPGAYVVAQTGNGGWISNGQSGYYWSGDESSQVVVLKKDAVKYASPRYLHRDRQKNNNVIYAGNNWGSRFDKTGKLYLYRDYNRDGEWYYYKDDRGQAHYFYLDNHREGQWERYMDRNGDVQYRYVPGKLKTIKNNHNNITIIIVR